MDTIEVEVTRTYSIPCDRLAQLVEDDMLADVFADSDSLAEWIENFNERGVPVICDIDDLKEEVKDYIERKIGEWKNSLDAAGITNVRWN